MNVRWDDLHEGEALPPKTMGPLSRTDFVRYQGASGDMVPIHHDETFARAAGYESPLGIGMLHAGALGAWAAEHFGPENVRRIRVRWQEQAWPGDVLAFSGHVARKYEERGERRIDVALQCTRAGGGIALEGWMTFVAPG